MGQVLLIAVFAVLFLRDSAPAPWFAPRSETVVAGITVGSMALIWAAAQALIWSQGRRMDRRGDLRAVGRCDAIVGVSRLTAVSVHAFCVLGLGWLDVVRGAVGDLVLVDELIAVLPVLLVFVGGWWSMYPIDRRLREAALIRDLDEGRGIRPMPSRAAYVLSALRHHAAMILLPVMAIAAWNELIERGSRSYDAPGWLPLLGLQVVGMGVGLTLMPAVLRRVWDTVRLGPGPLRDVLERMCHEHRVRVRELLVWRTHGTMLNGAVMGLIGPLRYIMLTDALLESLSGSEVEAVMAHELGHVRRRHMVWLGIAGLGSIMLAGIAAQVTLGRFVPGWEQRPWAQGAAFLPAMTLGLLVFGVVSRRFEWQADAFAAQHLSGYRLNGPVVAITAEAAGTMVGALAAVARLNHIPRQRFTFRHGSIASRQERLLALVGQPANQLKPDRQAGRWKIAAAIAICAAVLLSVRFGVS